MSLALPFKILDAELYVLTGLIGPRLTDLKLFDTQIVFELSMRPSEPNRYSCLDHISYHLGDRIPN